MNIDYGLVFGIASLILIQTFFAIAAVFLYLSLKADKNKLVEAQTAWWTDKKLLEIATNKLESSYEKLVLKIDGFRKSKIDGWEDGDKELVRQLRSLSARVASLHRLIKKEPEVEEEVELPQNSYPLQPQETTNPDDIQGSFGKTAGGK